MRTEVSSKAGHCLLAQPGQAKEKPQSDMDDQRLRREVSTLQTRQANLTFRFADHHGLQFRVKELASILRRIYCFAAEVGSIHHKPERNR